MLGEPWATSRYDLRVSQSPDAPDVDQLDDSSGGYGWVHSYETGSTVDGPGVRVTVFMNGCFLRCMYCHNPDTWHLRDGTRVSIERAELALAGYATALRSMGGGLTISGGEPLVQAAFTRRLFSAAKRLGLHTALDTSGFLGVRADDEYLENVDLVLLDIKSWEPGTYRKVTRQDLQPTIAFAERLARLNKPVWVRFVLVPGLTDAPANVEGLARFIAPMGNVEWVEVLPFHQMGSFKWKAIGLRYKLEGTEPPTSDLHNRVLEQFRAAGCRAR
ncbi:MAG: pyruvate formate lyase-activating protein [Chelatococcus sp.]|nr:pyruvate formate lyase-activating protein [Chelatococcus sp. HY11]MBX3547324.1 pyruvate formate lyase-activating protein [Chelatococcus sp.]